MANVADWLSASLKVSSDLSGKLKGLRDVERQLDQVELKKELLDAAEQALELREALLRAREEIQDRDRTISKLEEALSGREVVRRINGLLRQLGADGEPTEVRICDRCKAVDGYLVPMNQEGHGRYRCPNCKVLKAEDNAPPRPTPRVIMG